MAPRKHPTASPVARDWWTAHPNGEHEDCVAHLIAKGYRRKGSERLTSISHQAKALLNRSENGKLSELVKARRRGTRTKNVAAKKRKATREANGTNSHRHWRELDDTPHLRAYWEAHLEDGNHDDAMQSVPDGIDTCIAHSYQARSKVRAGGYANGNGDGAVAETPSVTAPVEFDATDTAEDGSVAELLDRAEAFIAEARQLKSTNPIKAPAPMEKAMKAIELSLKGMATAMANA